jgi:hypothetical protein
VQGFLEAHLSSSEEKVFGDFLEKFALKDIPVPLMDGHSRALVEHRGVGFVFSADQKNAYIFDVLAGRLFLRVGYADRIEVVRKERERAVVVGAMPIGPGGRIRLGDRRYVKLDSARRPLRYLRVDRLIEVLSARDIPVTARGKIKNVNARIYNLHLVFPMRRGNCFRPEIEAGRLYCRAYHRQILVGIKDDSGFREIGRVSFSADGYLLTADGRRVRFRGQPVKKNDSRCPWLNVEKLIPELARLEKRPTASRAIMYREIRYLFDLKPGDVYFPDLEAGCLVLRAVGSRIELFVDKDKDGKEFIGSFGTDEKGRLLTEGKARLEIKAGDRRDVRLSTLVKAFRPNGQEMHELVRLLVNKNYNRLYEIFSNGNAKKWLKMLSLFGRVYLADPKAKEVIGVKVMFALAYGVEYLAKANSLSPDLRTAFLKEILGVMAQALDNPGLARVKVSLRMQYLRALAASAGQPFDPTTEEQR